MPPKYPVVDPAPTLDTVTANFGLGEYATWIGVTALAVPLGHLAGALAGRREGGREGGRGTGGADECSDCFGRG